jgi:hypothetical protein
MKNRSWIMSDQDNKASPFYFQLSRPKEAESPLAELKIAIRAGGKWSCYSVPFADEKCRMHRELIKRREQRAVFGVVSLSGGTQVANA